MNKIAVQHTMRAGIAARYFHDGSAGVSIKKLIDWPAMEERVDTEVSNKLLPDSGGEIL